MPDGRVLAIDADPAALERASARLPEAVATGRLLLRHANFARLGALAREAGIVPVDGVLLDLGLSSDQLAARERGFSFAAEGALDMRFDPTAGESAADLVNTLEADELADIFWRYGEERLSRPIARRAWWRAWSTGGPAASIQRRASSRRCVSPSMTS